MAEESKFLPWLKKNEADIILVVGIILISLISFGGGWLMGNKYSKESSNLASVQNKDDIKIEEIEFK